MQTPTVADRAAGVQPGPGPGADRRVLVRLGGEVCTKSSRTRRRFLGVLTRNARAALRRAGVPAEVRQEWTRLVVSTPEPASARDALSRVFGVHSVHETLPVPFTSLPGLVEALVPLYSDRVAGRSFAVRARRRERVRFTSHDLAVELGAALRPLATRVDLEAPDVEVVVEVHAGHADAILETTAGVGGLPLGTGGGAIGLFSGGFDSPVAAWRVMRRGTRLDLLICDLGGCGQVDQALAVAKQLALRWTAGLEPRFWVVDLAPVVLALTQRVNPRLRQILLRRAMYRAGSCLAEELGASALVTGESLAQVSTQTLGNIRTCEQAATVPVLRPLIGMGKDEIIAQARAIGTYESSARVQEHCSISPGRVETWSSPGRIEAVERAVEAEPLTEAWIREAVSRRRLVDLRSWAPGALPDLVVQSVPDGAVVVDVREPEEGPVAGDLRLPFSQADELLSGLDPGGVYVLVCGSGQRSYTIAREMARRGFTAYSLAGGVKAFPGRPRRQRNPPQPALKVPTSWP
ncbi:MAG TPA: THUMP domain-containing protein [Actinomycetes bacterium]|jgi:thiamine biosynthesis protein ThiI|nr:THUMP domain-containing protein [Actinomycetes bacterium]